MKKIFVILFVVIIIGTLCVQASQIEKVIEIAYNNLKVEINGNEFTPKTESGNEIEPFIYNGTTYLPVRGIAKAFNLNVLWKPENTTIILENPKTMYLDDLSFVSYDRDSYQSYMAKNKTEESEHGLKFNYVTDNTYPNEQTKSIQKVVYNVPAGSKTLNFNISKVRGNASVKIIGTDEILYNPPTIIGNNISWTDYTDMNIEIDVSKQKQITFIIELQGQYTGEWETFSGIQFENARFEM